MWEVAEDHFAANKSHGIKSVHRLAYSLIAAPVFSVVLETFSHTGISTGTTLLCVMPTLDVSELTSVTFKNTGKYTEMTE